MLITVFTPTYNRAKLLPRLYRSLKEQTNKDFEWVIVDDGSTDNTKEVIDNIITQQENDFPIRYFYKENGGKHTAINRGVREANGELFFIVDSDDILTFNSVELISIFYNQIRDKDSFCGVSGMKGDFENNKIGTKVNFNILDCTIAESGYKYHIHGDKAEIIRTSIMKEFPFPEYNDEHFCPEALVWNRISKRYKIRYFNKIIYLCEYLEGGLSDQQAKLLEKNKKATMLTYKEVVESVEKPILFRIRSAINFWRYTLLYSFFLDKTYRLKWYWIILLPLGLFVRCLKG